MKRLIFCFIFFALASVCCLAQSSKWSIKGGFVFIAPNGEYLAQRPNGKIVTTDIKDGYGFRIGISRHLTERSLAEISVTSFSKHPVFIHQEFPDGSHFQSSDIIRPSNIRLGYGLRLIKGKTLTVNLIADVSYFIFNNVTFESAGPPYDRTKPLEIEVVNNLRGGLHLNFITALHKQLRLHLDAGLLINRFQGTFATEDDIDPFSDIDLPFNPVLLSLGLEFFIK